MRTDKIFPENWKEIIQEKKVIFYNTSVGSLLKGRQKQIEKMRWVFGIFQQHPEIVLWWRPHPLELSTIESMAPDLAQEYVAMRRQYKEKNIGVLDESTDLNRAIAVSDAYYGDWSSVVYLYQAIKKPILYENYKIRSTEEALFLPAEICIREQDIWFLQLNSNKLVKVNKATWEVEDIISIPVEQTFKHRMYNYHIVDAGNKLLLLLEKSKNIYVYDIAAQSIQIHSLDTEKIKFHSEIVIKRDRKLLLFPYKDNRIWECDYNSGSVIKKACLDDRFIKAAKCHEIIDKDVYMVDSGSNRIYKYNLADNSFIIIKVGDENCKYWGIKKSDQYFVLPHTDKKAITLWNEGTGESTELTDFPKNYECMMESAYLDMFEDKGAVYIFPLYANMILKIDIKSRAITQEFGNTFFDAVYDCNAEKISDAMYLCAKREDDNIYAYALYKKCWQIFHIDSKKVQESPVFKIKSAEHKKVLETLIDSETDNEEGFCEGEASAICTLNNYIRDVSSNLKQRYNNQLYKNSIGANIYKFITDET